MAFYSACVRRPSSQLPESMTLGQLHEVIQMVMGGTDDHLHQFMIRGERYGEAARAPCNVPRRQPR
ncbi:hypothetical protein ACIP1U_24145 [Cupriavidus sp. NPDC089707]|uniref:IS1096 element passenger TnpR family protein n=1 Tax=Cupriavidus sp. NPDC089707 TaxID=3363963 RepID=UPI0038120776